MDNVMKTYYLKSINMNVPMDPNDPKAIGRSNIYPEMDHMRSAVSLLVHFKYILLYVKEHFFIDIDYKIDSFAPQLKTDLDHCHQLYNQLVETSKYLDFVRGKENNYHAKSPIYNAFNQHHETTHQLNTELQNLYGNIVYGDGTTATVVAGNSGAPVFTEANQVEHFRPLNEYEYFQTNSLTANTATVSAVSHVDKYPPAQCEPYVNQIVANQMRRNYTGFNQEGTSAQDNQTNKKPAKPKRSAAAGPRPKKEKKPQKKRKRVPEEWKRNKAKTLRNSGMEYISIKKKVIPAKKLQPPCVKCMQKCNDKINEEQRREIFAQYWALPNINMKRMYLASCITQIQPKYRYPKGDSNRKLNNAFHFKLKGKQMRVCKLFFLNTLDINNRTIQTVIKKLKSTGVVEEDRRGRRPKNKQANTSTAAETSSAADLSKTLEQASAELSQAAQISELSQHAQQSELSQSQRLLQTAEMGQTPGNQSMN